MLKKPRLLTLTVMALGGVLGCLVAAANVRPGGVAKASSRTTAPSPSADLATGADLATSADHGTGGFLHQHGCCQQAGEAREMLLAQTYRQLAQAASQKPSKAAESKKPNILFIMGDDVGWFNIGAYHQGMMSGKTPNLDKLASQGVRPGGLAFCPRSARGGQDGHQLPANAGSGVVQSGCGQETDEDAIKNKPGQ